MIEHVPVLLIALPILAAVVPTILGIRFDRVGWPVAVLGMLVHAALAVALAMTVLGGRRISYEVGGFLAPFGIELVADAFTAILVLLIGAVGLAVLAYARTAGPRTNSFYGLYLLLVAGLTGMTVTGDVFNLYVFLEITGLAAYGMVATGDRADAAVAALKYLLIGTVGASLYLLGVGYAFVGTGTLNMADMAEKLATLGYDSPLVLTAFGLVVGGLVVKIALYPLHTWQPDAYSTAPDSVSTLISALVSTVAAYALARILFSVFTVDFFLAVPIAQYALLAIASVSIVAGSLLAVTQTDIQRMLAYSSVSQFGLVVVGIALATPIAVVGAIVHLVGHAVMKGGLFAASGIVRRKTGVKSVEEFDGLADRAPIAAACFAVLSLAMVGVPPAVGFVGKWYIVVGAVRAGQWAVLAVVLASTLLTLAYFLRLIERMYFTAPDHGAGHDGESEPVGDAPVADGGQPAVSTGMVALIVVASITAVALGLVVPAIESALQPTLLEVLGL